jgi:hypothetical protein
MRHTITNDRFMESHTIMAKADTATRAPRGTKPVAQAFFSALEAIPEATRAAVSKAALMMIRDEMKTQKDKMKASAVKVKEAAAKEKAKTVAAKPAPVKVSKPAAKKVIKKAVAPKTNGAAPAPAKRRGRKPADFPAAA